MHLRISIPNPPNRSFHSHPRNNKLKPERHSVERIKTICCFNFFVVPLFFLPLFRVHQNNSRIGTKPGGFSWKQNRQIGESTVITVKVDLQNDIIARRRWNFIRCNGSHCLFPHPPISVFRESLECSAKDLVEFPRCNDEWVLSLSTEVFVVAHSESATRRKSDRKSAYCR